MVPPLIEIDLTENFFHLRLGKFIEDFSEFLKQHKDAFDVSDGFVVPVANSDPNLEEYNHWVWKTGPLQHMATDGDIPPSPPKIAVLKKVSKHQTKRVPRKTTKYEVDYDFTLQKFCH